VVVFEFGPFVLDPAKRSLLRDNEPQALTPKAFDVLLLLIEQRERVVSKDELLKTLWPGAFIEESNLSQQVFLLRRALNGDAEGVEYIATIPRRGYRFVAQVSERRSEPSTEVPAAAPAPRTRIGRLWVGTAVFGAVTFSALLPRWTFTGPDDATENSRVISVVAQAGVQGFPSISPDGNFVAFAWTGPRNAGPPDIWVKAVEGDGLRSSLRPVRVRARPCGRRTGVKSRFFETVRAYSSCRRWAEPNETCRVPARCLDGPRIRQSLLVRDRVGEAPFGIFQIDLEPGERRQLTQAPSGIGDWAFDVSPDGTMLAFVRYERPGVSDVYVVPMAGGEPRPRTDWRVSISRVAWTPDGRELIYAVDEGAAQTLFRIPASGQQPERGRRALHVSAVGPSLSRAGADQFARLAFISRRQDIGLRLVDLVAPVKGNTFQKVERFSDSTRIELPGSFSPQGDRIAFASDRSGSLNFFSSNRSGSPQIWKMPAAGGPAVRVTKAGGLEPQEAPDGRTVFYLDHPPPGAGGFSGSARLMNVSVDGGEEVVVLDAVRLSLWSVIEQGIVFVTVETEADALDFYSFSDRRIRQLGTLPFRISRVAGYGELAVSRDGRLALLNANDNLSVEIMVADRFR
jgi:DNA-binding winged helix-turn-helix (wHTH) protein/Tol biopolymer transport system component